MLKRMESVPRRGTTTRETSGNQGAAPSPPPRGGAAPPREASAYPQMHLRRRPTGREAEAEAGEIQSGIDGAEALVSPRVVKDVFHDTSIK